MKAELKNSFQIFKQKTHAFHVNRFQREMK